MSETKKIAETCLRMGYSHALNQILTFIAMQPTEVNKVILIKKLSALMDKSSCLTMQNVSDESDDMKDCLTKL